MPRRRSLAKESKRGPHLSHSYRSHLSPRYRNRAQRWNTPTGANTESISRDREWEEGAARKRLLQILEAVGLEDPWAGQQRRRLSAILFG